MPRTIAVTLPFALLAAVAPPRVATARTSCPTACVQRQRRARRPPVTWSARRFPRWGGPPAWQVGLAAMGLRGTGGALGDDTALLGLGFHLRYRGYRWGVSGEVGLMGRDYGRDAGGEPWVRRLTLPVDVSAMLYLVPGGHFNLYLAGGVRIQPNHLRLMASVDGRDHGVEEMLTVQAGVQGGGGVEIVLGRLVALMADVRAVGLVRADVLSDGGGRDLREAGVIPERSAAVQVKVGASIRF